MHSIWEPSKEEVDREAQKDRLKNPHGESNKPKQRSYHEIIRDLKKQYYTTLLS